LKKILLIEDDELFRDALANAADKGTGKLLGSCHQTGESTPLEFDIKQK